MKNEPIVIEKVYNALSDKVWAALTDKEQMKQWYFDLAEFKPVVGFEFQFEGGEEGKTFTHRCRIMEVVPGKKLSHTWRYEGYPGESLVTWELFAEGEKTRVKLTHAGLETFPPVQDFKRENFVTGWTQIVGTSLKEFVETHR